MAKVGSRGTYFNLMGLKHRSMVIPHHRILTLKSKGMYLVSATERLDYNGPPTELPIPTLCQVYGVSAGTDESYAPQSPGMHLMLSWGARDALIAMSTSGTPMPSPSHDVKEVKGFVPPEEGKQGWAAVFPSFSMPVGQDLTWALEDNALSLDLHNPDGDLEGGHPDDKLIVFLTYYIAKLT